MRVWQGGRPGYLLKPFQGFSTSGFSPLKELWAAATGANSWIIVLGAAGLNMLALLASLAIFPVRDES